MTIIFAVTGGFPVQAAFGLFWANYFLIGLVFDRAIALSFGISCVEFGTSS
jgi:hypothetical protein